MRYIRQMGRRLLGQYLLFRGWILANCLSELDVFVPISSSVAGFITSIVIILGFHKRSNKTMCVLAALLLFVVILDFHSCSNKTMCVLAALLLFVDILLRVSTPYFAQLLENSFELASIIISFFLRSRIARQPYCIGGLLASARRRRSRELARFEPTCNWGHHVNDV